MLRYLPAIVFVLSLVFVVACGNEEDNAPPSGEDLYGEPTVEPTQEVVTPGDGGTPEVHDVLKGNSLFAVLAGEPPAGWRELDDPQAEESSSRARWETVFGQDPPCEWFGYDLDGDGDQDIDEWFEFCPGVLVPTEESPLYGETGEIVFEERSCRSAKWRGSCGPWACLHGEVFGEADGLCYLADIQYEVTNDLTASTARFIAEFDLQLDWTLVIDCDYERYPEGGPPYWENPNGQAGEIHCDLLQRTEDGELILWATGNATRRL